jgi:hypothetical protein
MPDTLNAADLRRWATRCATEARDKNCTAEESERLLKMHESLLALAESADWLNGKTSAAALQATAE